MPAPDRRKLLEADALLLRQKIAIQREAMRARPRLVLDLVPWYPFPAKLCELDAPAGFEPALTASKADVLPLDDGAIAQFAARFPVS